MTPPQSRDIVVVGAGIVGVACALHLQADGHRVTLLDPRPPGEGASFGNAGVIATGIVTPVSTPGLWRQVPAMLLDPDGPLRLRWRYLPRIAPWLLRFLAAGRRRRAEAIATALATLMTQANEAHGALAQRLGVADMLRANGRLSVYRSAHAFARTRYQRETMARLGVPFRILDADEIRQMEPGLAPGFGKGIFVPGERLITSPHRYVQRLARGFLQAGSRIVPERALRIGPRQDGENGGHTVETDAGEQRGDLVVIAAGAWSRPLAEGFGDRLPLDTERGYHFVLAADGPATLRRPVELGDQHIVLAPMSDGLRMTSGVELGGLEAPPDFARLRRLHRFVAAALPGADCTIRSQWMGFRPSMPDSLPVIGPLPNQPTVYCAFGHGHLGLTFGPLTGAIVADLIAGRTPSVDPAPYSPARFR